MDVFYGSNWLILIPVPWSEEKIKDKEYDDWERREGRKEETKRGRKAQGVEKL